MTGRRDNSRCARPSANDYSIKRGSTRTTRTTCERLRQGDLRVPGILRKRWLLLFVAALPLTQGCSISRREPLDSKAAAGGPEARLTLEEVRDPVRGNSRTLHLRIHDPRYRRCHSRKIGKKDAKQYAIRIDSTQGRVFVFSKLDDHVVMSADYPIAQPPAGRAREP